MKDATIYPHSLEYAIAHDESRAYHASFGRNLECAAAIDKTITASNYELYHYNLPEALNSVTKEFGLDRVTWVVAAAVQYFDNDGRLSQTNKEWAREFPIPHEKGVNFLPRTHLAVFDGFTDDVREARLHDLAQTVGAYEKSHHMAERNRLTYFHSGKDCFVPNRGVTERRLTERCAEIAEKQSIRIQLRAAKKAGKATPAPEKKHHHEGDKFRYYITNDALNVGTFPHMAGMDVQESIKPVNYEHGTVTAFGFIDYQQPLTPEQEREYSLIPSTQNPIIVWGAEWKPVSNEQRESRLQRQKNYLKTFEMGLEQNYNQLDGLINNQEPPRVNQGYVILESEMVGHKEFVLAENPKAPQPFATWVRNVQNDEQMGGENFFWGHYFTDEAAARRDFRSRVREEEQDLAEHRPSILSQLKTDAAHKDLPAAPEPGRKKDAPER